MSNYSFSYKTEDNDNNNEEEDRKDFSFKVDVNTTNHLLDFSFTRSYDFTKDELLFEEDDSPSKEDLSYFLMDSGIERPDILIDLILFACDASNTVEEGFTGVITITMDISIRPEYEAVDLELEQATAESVSEIRFKPADKASIKALKTTKFKKRRARGPMELCVVCLEDFIDGLELTRTPCRHDFHGECIVKWLNISHMCPLCRFPLPSE